MKLHVYLFLAFSLVFLSCEDENPEPSVTPTSITVMCNKDKSEAFLVEETMVFSVAMVTDPSVGIASFTIKKEGAEIFSKSDYTTNNVNFEFTYGTTREDLEAGEIDFTFELLDKNSVSKDQTLSVKVEVDLPITVGELDPNPGWDLVNDMAVDSSIPDNVDILQYNVQLSPFSSSIYWTSLNGAKFYDASDKSINFFDINLSIETLETAISDLRPVDTILIAEGSFGSSQPPLPLIVNIRNGQELILVDFSTIQASMVGYRKSGN